MAFSLRSSFQILLLLTSICLLPQAQAQDGVFFSNAVQSGYYDSGLAFKSGNSLLRQGGPSGDKIITVQSPVYGGRNALDISWTSNSGGDWSALVIAPGFAFQDITDQDYLSFWVLTD